MIVNGPLIIIFLITFQAVTNIYVCSFLFSYHANRTEISD